MNSLRKTHPFRNPLQSSPLFLSRSIYTEIGGQYPTPGDQSRLPNTYLPAYPPHTQYYIKQNKTMGIIHIINS